MKIIYSSLKKVILNVLVLAISSSAFAQTEKVVNNSLLFSESHSNFQITPSALNVLPPMWNVQKSIDATAAAGTAGLAGAVWVGNEYWVAEWASANIHRIDSLGNLIATFTVPGLTGARGMSYGDSSVWIGNATTTVTEVDPVTLSVLSTITLPAGITARQISYDATANGGAGGLWVGNVFGAGANTDINLVSLSGAVLSTIPQTTHTLSGIYGFAVDNYSTGGPYLWAFWQPGNPGAIISQLSLPTGTPTGTSFDVNADLGLMGIAGGIFIDTTIVPGEMSIGCLLQDNPDILTIYELDFVPINFDASAEGLTFVPGYTQIPVSQLGPINFNGNAVNKGQMALNNVTLDIDVLQGASSVFSNSQVISTVPVAGNTPYSFGPYTPGAIGSYDATVTVTTDTTQPDAVSMNDAQTLSFNVTDSTMARDDGIHNGGTGYAVSTTASGYALTLFTIPNSDTLTSVTIELETPMQGDTTFAIVTNSLGGIPGFITNIGNPVIINGGQNIYTLKFPGGGVVLPAGTYGIGVYEGSNTTINLRQSNNIYTPGSNYFQVNTTPGVWTVSNIQTARFIRPNFGVAPINIGISELNDLENGISLFPNPSNGVSEIYFDFNEVMDIKIELYDNFGRLVKTDQLQNILQKKYVLDLNGKANGLYFVQFNTKYGSIVKKLMLNN